MISEEMLLANMFIGYFIPSSQWPCPFEDLRMQLQTIHAPFISTVDGQNREVRPEVVLASTDADYGVGLEVKSSRLTEDQLQRYAALDQISVQRELGFDPESEMTYDTTFFTEAENGEKLVRFIRRELRKHGLDISGEDPFPVIVRNEYQVCRHAGAFSHPLVQAVFSEGISANEGDQPPTHFIRFTAQSPISSMLDDVLNQVHARIVKNVPFTTRDVVRSIVNYWEAYGTEERRALINKVHRILTKASTENYRPFFRLGNVADEVGDTEWRPVQRVLNVQRIQALGTANQAFMSRYEDATNEEFRDRQQLTLVPDHISGNDG